jgi:phospholipase C
MGYYDERDLPSLWGLARDYVLFDRFFSAVPYGIRLNRSYWVTAAPPPGGKEKVPPGGLPGQPTIFDRLEAAGVSWKFYVENYVPTDALASADALVAQSARVPLLNFARFRADPRLSSHIVDLDEYYRDLEQGTLPQVAYVTSSGADERSARSIPAGQKLIRTMVNQLMMSRYWNSSALLVSYDGAGGWYDHVPPVQLAGTPGGLRVPALLVSPYARRGQVDHTRLDYTSALRFIEENWGLQPLTTRDGAIASLVSAFDFTSPPRAARLLPAGVRPEVPPAPRTGAIYGLYGSAMLVGLLLLAGTVAGRGRIAGLLRRRWPIRLRTGVVRR